ncbi:MAG: hypothetical protein CM1200mP30_29560 [Pseudomonadota bacterium]|nr:MAG: hypothetical protein CM1200mP30_29560 [Pseudomonadota bacterium]
MIVICLLEGDGSWKLIQMVTLKKIIMINNDSLNAEP